MSELKAMNYFQVERDYLAHEAVCDSSKKLYYFAADADKVIAEMEESHKMEVEQLLIRIAELKASIGKLLKSKV